MTKRKPPPTPDLLTPVVEAVKSLNTPQRLGLAKAAGVSISTIHILALNTAIRGPSYRLVEALHRLLISEGWKP
jgi:hypothetical protein